MRNRSTRLSAMTTRLMKLVYWASMLWAAALMIGALTLHLELRFAAIAILFLGWPCVVGLTLCYIVYGHFFRPPGD
jgi:hypothetical protein